MNSLAGKVALVTGASRGIGKGIALALGAAGATVAGTATTEVGAEGISRDLTAAGITGLGYAMDVNDAAQIESTLAAIQQQWGEVAILVNNAGITRDNLLVRMKPEEWDQVIATDLTSVFALSRGCLRAMMKARAGRIISITSVVGSLGNAGQTNYAAAKAGIEGFSRSLAREVGSRNITVNAIAPGFIDTDMTRALEATQRSALEASIPLARLGAAADIAAAVLYLAGPGGAYVTGQTLHVNGGMYLT
jgi:3-oxoacyl-[acyl-carrier protein] reductase